MDRLIVNFTPTGMIPRKQQTPYVPVSPQEIIEDVRQACQLGISMVHLHARDQQSGQPAWERSIYQEIISGIREFAPELVVCVSTSGRDFNELPKRADVLSLEGCHKPDMASLTLSSLNFNAQPSINAPETIQCLAAIMMEQGIMAELEVFDSGMINYARYLIRKQLLKPPYYFNLILGNIACAQADLLHIGILIRDLPEDSLCSLGGVGYAQRTVNSLAIAMGFGVRVGLEDNIWFDNQRTKLATNLDLLARIHDIARVHERELMAPSELRERLGLLPGHGQYGREV